jgi:hypothetical protein
MNTLRLLVLATALGLTLGACGKKEAPADGGAGVTEVPSTDASTAGSTDPSAASSPSQREATGTDTPEAGTGGETDPGAAATPSQEEATKPPGN